VKTLYIEPGSSWENGYESFNGKLRNNLLARELFYTWRRLIERWRRSYNQVRPHGSIEVDLQLVRSSGKSSYGTPPGRTRRARCDGGARRCRSSSNSWPWCGCGRYSAKLDAAVGQRARQPDAVLSIERHDPVVEDFGRGDRRLAVV
jgi:hypothetical protein